MSVPSGADARSRLLLALQIALVPFAAPNAHAAGGPSGLTLLPNDDTGGAQWQFPEDGAHYSRICDTDAQESRIDTIFNRNATYQETFDLSTGQPQQTISKTVVTGYAGIRPAWGKLLVGTIYYRVKKGDDWLPEEKWDLIENGIDFTGFGDEWETGDWTQTEIDNAQLSIRGKPPSTGGNSIHCEEARVVLRW